MLDTGVKAVRTALAVVRRITNELEKELRICDDDTLKYLQKMKDEESKLRDSTLVTLSGELDSEVHQVEAEISKLEDKMTELEMELMKRNSNLWNATQGTQGRSGGTCEEKFKARVGT